MFSYLSLFFFFNWSHEMIRRLSSNPGDIISQGQLYDSHMSKKIIFSCSMVMWARPLRFDNDIRIPALLYLLIPHCSKLSQSLLVQSSSKSFLSLQSSSKVSALPLVHSSFKSPSLSSPKSPLLSSNKSPSSPLGLPSSQV